MKKLAKAYKQLAFIYWQDYKLMLKSHPHLAHHLRGLAMDAAKECDRICKSKNENHRRR